MPKRKKKEFDESKDEILFEDGFVGDYATFTISVHRYDGGKQKVQIKRIAPGKGPVQFRSSTKLKRLSAGELEEMIPILQEALQVMRAERAKNGD